MTHGSKIEVVHKYTNAHWDLVTFSDETYLVILEKQEEVGQNEIYRDPKIGKGYHKVSFWGTITRT